MSFKNSIVKNGNYWALIFLIPAILLLVLVSQLITAITLQLFFAIGSINMYSIPVGDIVYFFVAIMIVFAITLVIGAIRGIVSSKVSSAEEYEKHPIQKTFGISLIVFGGLFLTFVIWVVLAVNWNYIMSLAQTEPDLVQEYMSIAIALFVILSILGFAIVISGIRSWKVVRYKRKNDPNILMKLFGILILIGSIAGASYIPTLIGDPNIPKTATFPDSYPKNAGPFVQFGPADSNHHLASPAHNMAVWWFTNEASSDRMEIKYGTTANPAEMQSQLEESGGDLKYHVAYLSNLNASTMYYYTIPSFDSTVYNFTTAPENGESFRFTSVGDTRNSGGNSTSYYGDINHMITKFYQEQGEDFAFKINVGDIPSSGTDLKSWEVYLDDVSVDSTAATHPHMIAMGNHELGGDNGANYDYIYVHPRYYAFDYGAAYFIMIHNYDTLIEVLSSGQLTWLENELKENYNKKFLIVSMHVPPLSTGDFNMNPLLQAQLLPLFEKYKVDFVLTGHDHHYDSFWKDKDTDWEGTFFYVNGGGGSPLDHYIMTRADKQWLTWYHNRSSAYGLYQHDDLTVSSHVYGELSWGFMDIQVTATNLSISYYRWLSLEKYFEITGQNHTNFKIRYFTEQEIQDYGLDSVELVHTLSKTRVFP